MPTRTVKTTDGVHIVNIEVPNPAYAEWLRTVVLALRELVHPFYDKAENVDRLKWIAERDDLLAQLDKEGLK